MGTGMGMGGGYGAMNRNRMGGSGTMNRYGSGYGGGYGGGGGYNNPYGGGTMYPQQVAQPAPAAAQSSFIIPVRSPAMPAPHAKGHLGSNLRRLHRNPQRARERRMTCLWTL